MGLASGVNVVHRVEVVFDLDPVRVAIVPHVNRKLRHKVVTLNPAQVLCHHSLTTPLCLIIQLRKVFFFN